MRRPVPGRRRVVATVLLAGVSAAACLPAPATKEARSTAELYTIFMAIAAVVAVIVIGLALFAILRYRRRSDDEPLPAQVHGNLRFEVVWTALPIATIVVLLVLTVGVLNGFDDSVRATPGAEIRVTAFRWGWRFEYPADGIRVEGIGQPGPEVVVPVGEPVRVTLTGADVIHAFFVPQFLFKKDAIPGQQNVFAFTVDEPGRYGGQCAELCGIGHSRMPFTVVAVARADYDAWVAAHRGGAPVEVTPGPSSLGAPAPSGASAPPSAGPSAIAPDASGPYESTPTPLVSPSP